VVRKYRNAVYTIEVKNPRHVNRGISQFKVDGKEIKGNLAPVFGDNRNHMVEAVMG